MFRALVALLCLFIALVFASLMVADMLKSVLWAIESFVITSPWTGAVIFYVLGVLTCLSIHQL